MLISLTKVRIIFSYAITNVYSQKVLAAGETKHAWTNKSLKPVNAESELPEVYSLLKKIMEK
ncbi:hypothetical protein [Anaerocolumna sp. MB42-C2]|uniref:hypothetical protein n=1 Tax=Anaerocolumna sp. MB42-C2 TaxID=3070997 RepID=UPI0027E08AA9|nr:hypothetical protein [Anaerocolumna sp. MB42-C2]WMJ87980.1 hypothetical protein RBU59_00285 [Anaerocolumna sp. MB42-C2]